MLCPLVPTAQYASLRLIPSLFTHDSLSHHLLVYYTRLQKYFAVKYNPQPEGQSSSHSCLTSFQANSVLYKYFAFHLSTDPLVLLTHWPLVKPAVFISYMVINPCTLLRSIDGAKAGWGIGSGQVLWQWPVGTSLLPVFSTLLPIPAIQLTLCLCTALGIS